MFGDQEYGEEIMRTILIEGVYYVEIYGMASERAVSSPRIMALEFSGWRF